MDLYGQQLFAHGALLYPELLPRPLMIPSPYPVPNGWTSPHIEPRAQKRPPPRTGQAMWKQLKTSKVPQQALAAGNVNAKPTSDAKQAPKPNPESGSPASSVPCQPDTPSASNPPGAASAPTAAPKRPHRKAAAEVTNDELPGSWRREILAEGNRATGSGRVWGVRRMLPLAWYGTFAGRRVGASHVAKVTVTEKREIYAKEYAERYGRYKIVDKISKGNGNVVDGTPCPDPPAARPSRSGGTRDASTP